MQTSLYLDNCHIRLNVEHLGCVPEFNDYKLLSNCYSSPVIIARPFWVCIKTKTRFHFVLGILWSKQIGRLYPVYINIGFSTLCLYFFFSLPHYNFSKCPAPVPISLKSFLVRLFTLFLLSVSNQSSHHLPTSRCICRARLQRGPSHQRLVDMLGFPSWYHPCPLHHFQVLSG